MERTRAFSGSPYEAQIGFRTGDRIVVSGTAAVWPDGTVDPDVGVQTRRCIDIIAEALADVGATLDDAVRTRLFLVDPDDADAVGAVHRERLGQAQPAATMVVVKALLDPRWRVEVEAEAVL